jgi:hypothetical protein
MISLTERKRIIGALQNKQDIPTACEGPGDPKTHRFLFEEHPLKGYEVVYCPPKNRMTGAVCDTCILFKAADVTTGKPLSEIKTRFGM